MFRTLASLVVDRKIAWTIVLFVLSITMIAGVYAVRVVQDDDVLKFLPRSNPEVAAFYEVADRYGSLDIALVGIESEDVFEPGFVERLQKATKRLNQTEGIQHALSITSVEDFTPDPERGGIATDYLVREIPKNDEERARLREKVLSRDHVVGNLVSEDGKAVMLYCFAVPGTEQRAIASRVRAIVEESFPNEKKYWHGAPFVSTYIYDTTQKDLRRLAPWACAAIALLVLAAFRDLVGTSLSLLATTIGIVIPFGIMGAFGVHTNIVLGSMPVILFALGSAYGIHIMSRFYALGTTMPREAALKAALEEVGPAVLGSGLTTVFGLLSFVMMDIAPLRSFGFFTALGLTIALVVALVFIPAVITISPIKGRVQAPLPGIARATAALAAFSLRKRLIIGVTTGAVTLAAGFFVSRVDSRLDTTAFFDPGSPPADADEFMQRKFGGSSFVQIEVKGDMTDPTVLREVQALADRALLVPGVSSVNHIAAIVAQTNEAMEDVRRVPDTPEKVKLLLSFLTGKQAVSMTVNDERQGALIHVKLRPSRAAEVEEITAKLEALAAEVPKTYAVVTTEPGKPSARVVSLVAARVRALATIYGAKIDHPEAVDAAVTAPPAAPPASVIEPGIVAFVKSEAFGVALPEDVPPDAPARIAKAVAELGPPPTEDDAKKAWRARFPGAVSGALGKPADDPTVDDAALALEQSVGDVWTQAAGAGRAQGLIQAAGIVLPEGPKAERFTRAIGYALLDRDAPTALSPEAGGGSLDVRITGLPVLYRGLSSSVFNNQWNSLWFALLLVIAFKALLFRSVGAGILSSIPTLITLVLIYGTMGLVGVHLDIGTSMLASLIIGAGDDYAVEYLWAWSAPEGALEKAARDAAIDTAAGIWTNAFMMAVGFFVLTLGEARPLKNVGGLTAAAMIAAGAATFLICPVLARKSRYAPTAEPAQPAPEEGEPEPATSRRLEE
ncbi:MAG: MMPL family transporter [Myxococcales bacterium]|nr:MMPL family transporter [Myxococcales bacterium]